MKTKDILLITLGGLIVYHFVKKRKEKKLQENELAEKISDDLIITSCKEKLNAQRAVMKTTANFDWIAWEKQSMQRCIDDAKKINA